MQCNEPINDRLRILGLGVRAPEVQPTAAEQLAVAASHAALVQQESGPELQMPRHDEVVKAKELESLEQNPPIESSKPGRVIQVKLWQEQPFRV